MATIMGFPVRSVVLLSAATVSITYFVISKYISHARFKRMEAAAGAAPPNMLPSKYPLGLDTLIVTIKHIRQKTFRDYLIERHDRYGNTYLSKMAGLHEIYSNDPEIAKTVFAAKADDYQIDLMRVETLRDFMGPGIFTSNGREWQHSRALVRPSFARANVEDTDALEEHFQNLLASIPADGAEFDMQRLFFRFTIDFSTDVLFGASTTKGGKSRDDFIDAFDYCVKHAAMWMMVGPLYRLMPHKKYDEMKKVVREFADRYVLQMLEKPSMVGDRYCFLKEMVKETRDQTVLRSELLNILLAARDTTACLMGNMWHALVRHPDVCVKLRREVDTLNGRRPTWNEMKNMRFLQDTINEALRMYTVVPINGRETVRTTLLPRGGGPNGDLPILLPPNAPVFIDFYAMNKRPDIWGPDSHEFNPDRWRRPEIQDRIWGSSKRRQEEKQQGGVVQSQPGSGWLFSPFSGGARICLGQQMATVEASYVTVRLLQELDRIEPRDGRPWQEDFNFIMSSGNGTRVAAYRK